MTNPEVEPWEDNQAVRIMKELALRPSVDQEGVLTTVPADLRLPATRTQSNGFWLSLSHPHSAIWLGLLSPENLVP